MFQYYALLWLRYRTPIFPIAVYLKGGSTSTRERYRVRLLDRDVLDFGFECVSLQALAALMDRGGVEDALSLRALMLQAIAESGLDAARKFLLLNLVETYFALAPAEAEAFERLLAQSEFREVREMQVTWADRMKEEGFREGRQEGRQEGLRSGVLEGKRETLRRQLIQRFGPLPATVSERVDSLDSLSELDSYLDRVLTARTLNEIGLT